MISSTNRESFVLDVGCYESPILPMLKKLINSIELINYKINIFLP